MRTLTLPAAIALAIAICTPAHARVMKDPAVVPTPDPAQPAAAPAFQWDDAGIGAAATVVLLGGGALAAGTVRRRRMPLPS